MVLVINLTSVEMFISSRYTVQFQMYKTGTSPLMNNIKEEGLHISYNNCIP